MRKPVKYLGWFKKQANGLQKMRRDLEALRIEHRAVLQEIDDGKEYANDLENAIQVLDAEVNKLRRELARRFASYDMNFRNDAMLDPSLLD
jgi:Skp family chaperone for outer membrane proteins